jgi:primosomal protein N' (replication factor Y) (superfamily II helicase)
VTIARVLPNVIGLDRHFDYLVPAPLVERVAIGSLVRVPLHGRRVGGWVVELDPIADPHEPAPATLKDIAKVTGHGPSREVIELAAWAAHRWVGRRRNFLVPASPPTAVTAFPADRRTATAPGPASPASSRLLQAGGGILRLPPTSDPLPAILSAVALGPVVVVMPESDAARLTGGRLRRHGLSVADYPDDWAAAAGGVDVVIGARSAAWAPCPGMAAAVIVDEHDESLQEEGSPTWHARTVVEERCRRAGTPVLLVSPVPSATSVAAWPTVRPSAERERAGWPIVDLVDRSGEEPWKRSLLTSALIAHLRDNQRRVVCVSNTTGRARLVACRSCRALARCEVCDAALALDDDGLLACGRCDLRRPAVCATCGSTAFANLRPGVTRLREELEAAANRPVALVTGATSGPLPDVDVFVGTEAVLHRVGRADVVAFLDIDRELLAPRYRAWEQTLALLVLAARMVGPRDRGGRILLQTFIPDHVLLRAAVLADPGRAVDAELERRRQLALPPYSALAEVAGPGAAAFVASLDPIEGIDVGGGPDRFLVRADDADALSAALRTGARTKGDRLRIAVDPPRI